MPHQASGVDFSTGGNDLGFTNPLLLCSGGKRGRDFRTEDDILDEDTLDGNTPLVGDITNNFGNFVGDGFALGDNALNGAGADDVSEGGLCSFDERLAEISDAKGCAVRVGDLEVDDGVTIIGW